MYDRSIREKVTAEYIAGGIGFRKLGKKHGIDFRLIHWWVMTYRGIKKKRSPKKAKVVEVDQTRLPTDVKLLQAQLRKAELHNKLLNAMIDIAEDQLKIDIRKKSGTKQ